MARVEAVLFLANEPLGVRKIGQFASLADATEARTLIRRLNEHYDSGGSAFRVEEVAGGFQLLTRRKFAGWLRRLHQIPVETRLSGPALETLAVVAYRQPVLRATIESIRGVQCGEMLRQLMERDLVKIVGRSDELGRPFLYGTTKRFLQVFGLRHFDELPRADYLRAAAPGAGLSSSLTTGPGNDRDDNPTSSNDFVEESDVTIAASSKFDTCAPLDEEEQRRMALIVKAEDEDEDEVDDDADDDDDDEEDEDEEEDDFDDDDFDDDDWEEVDDDDDLEEDDEEDDELEEDDEEDEEWDDDEDDEWEDDEEEEKEKDVE